MSKEEKKVVPGDRKSALMNWGENIRKDRAIKDCEEFWGRESTMILILSENFLGRRKTVLLGRVRETQPRPFSMYHLAISSTGDEKGR